MLDIRLIRERPDFVRQRLATREAGDEQRIDEVLTLDEQRRKLLNEVEAMKAQRNRASKEIGALMAQKRAQEAEAKKKETRELGDRIGQLDKQAVEAEQAREKVMPEHHVLCYAAADGKMLWDIQVPPGPWLRTDFRSGPGGGYAAPTPATDGKLLYCLFGSSVMAAVDFEGKIAWRKEIRPYTFDVTVASSPVIYGETVIVLCAMAKPEDSKVVAYDKASGDVKWEKDIDN